MTQAQPDADAKLCYTVRISARTKRAHLKISPHGEIEVVIHKRFDSRLIPAFIARHRDWLERKLIQVQQRRSAYPELHNPLPTSIALAAIDERWWVDYRDGVTARLHAYEEQRLLRIDHGPAKACHALMRQWLSDKGRAHLRPWLRQLSQELALPFAKVAVRGQKTRWGSCSAHGNININRNLLFLPPPLVRYVFIHELCHTVHMNHSARFWSLVAQLEPDYRALDVQLRHAAQYIPVWAHADE